MRNKRRKEVSLESNQVLFPRKSPQLAKLKLNRSPHVNQKEIFRKLKLQIDIPQYQEVQYWLNFSMLSHNQASSK